MREIIIIALAPTGKGISGSDRIFIELARQWSKEIPVKIFTTLEGVEMMSRQKLKGKFLEVKAVEKKLPTNFFLKYIYKIYLGIKLGFILKPNTYNLMPITYIYSSSDFLMDVLPAVLLKLRFGKKVKWIATWYQTAPKPIQGFSQGKRGEKYRLSAFYYWLSQLTAKPFINKLADKVIVNNEDERKQFPKMESEGKVIVLLGAVRLGDIETFLSTNYKLLSTKKYDAVFQGRFHPQKGVVELINIWRKVVDKKPDAKLAIIGDGPLMRSVKSKVRSLKLGKNVKLFGWVFDGPKKYKIFSQSKLVVHPAFYDSGGMASAEAMAFGIPAVGFNLKAYKSYYPKGMIKVKIGDLDAFARVVLKLLDDSRHRKSLGKQALKMIEQNWSWDKRAEQILNQIMK